MNFTSLIWDFELDVKRKQIALIVLIKMRQVTRESFSLNVK